MPGPGFGPGLGEVVRVLAAAVVRFWCERDDEAAGEAYAALGVFLRCE